MWRHINFWILTLGLWCSLCGCSVILPQPTSTPTAFPTQTATPPFPTRTPTVTRTATSTPTTTPTPTLTPTPTSPLLAKEGTPLPLPLPVISVDNAYATSGLAEWREPDATDLAWAPDGRTLVVAGPSMISMYDVQTRQKVRTLYPRSQGVVSIAFNNDGSWLAAGSRLGSEKMGYGSNLELWLGPDWQPIGLVHGEWRGLSQVVFSPNRLHFLAAFSNPEPMADSAVEIWNTHSWEITATLKTGTVLGLAVTADGSLLATTPDRYAIQVWDLKRRIPLYRIPTSFTGAVNCLVFGPGGGLLASGHYDGVIRLWDTLTGKLIRAIQMKDPAVVESIAFSPDGSLIATGDSYSDTNIQIWGVTSGELLRTLQGHAHAVDHLRFSPDGQLLASSSYDGTVRVWGVRR